MRKVGQRINTKVVSDILTGEILERRSYMHFGKIARAMGVRLATVFSTTFIGPLPANATETLVLTTGPISMALDNAQVILLWFACILAGTSVTSHVFRIRRGTTTAGAALNANPWQNAAIAAAQTTSSGVYVDSPGVVAGQQYSLTVVQTAATVAGTFEDGCLMAIVL